ncbi:MAG: D-tagatose 3-epimerase [Cryobacterium sp.]|jgi:protein FrlC|nr:D-tagatose 3-epimerase [Cryobacterium sp.]
MHTITTDQITGSNFSYHQLTFDRFLDDMVTLSRRHVELWGIAPHLHIPQLGLADVRRVRRQLRERELSVACITPEQVIYPVNLASGVQWLRRSSIDMFLKAVDVCVELESPLLFLTAGRGFEDEPRTDAWKRSADSLREIAEHALRSGISCVLEPLQRVESNLVNSTADIRRMLDAVGSDNLGVALDTVAMAVAGETVYDYDTAFGQAVKHVHLIDGTPAGHLAWGDGDLPLAGYLQALGDVGYRGFMTFELFGDGSYALDPLPALQRSLAAVEAALAEAVPA